MWCGSPTGRRIRAASFPDAGLTGGWSGFGFASRPPEAALAFHHGQPDGDSVIVRLTRPRYDKRHGTLSFAASWVDPHTVTSGPLVADAKTVVPDTPAQLRRGHPLHQRRQPPVINGCVIQSFMECPGADLRGADLHGLDLLDAHLSGANLEYANVSGAKLRFADLTDAKLLRANLSGTDFRAADFHRANLAYADFHGANLDHADLSDARGFGPAGAKLCGTVMPNGRTDDTGC